MDVEQFEKSLADQHPPTGLPPLVLALWWDARGEWEQAHGIAQDIENADGSWVHAFLHRREGDQANAAYWYRRAARPVSREPFDQERVSIAAALLGDS